MGKKLFQKFKIKVELFLSISYNIIRDIIMFEKLNEKLEHFFIKATVQRLHITERMAAQLARKLKV